MAVLPPAYYNQTSDVADFDEQVPFYLTSQAYFPVSDGAPTTTELPDFELSRRGVVVTFVIKNSNGAPLAGQAPTWLVYKDAVTGANQSIPSISSLGLGHYKFTLSGTNPAGLLDFGINAVPRYQAYSSISSVWVFAAFTSQGAPLTGLTPTWHSLKRASDGTDYTPQPAITALGSGLYKTTFVSERLTGVIDLGAQALPRYIPYDTDRPLILIPISES